MWDITMIAMGLFFFAIAIAYVKGCALLSKTSQHPGRAEEKA